MSMNLEISQQRRCIQFTRRTNKTIQDENRQFRQIGSVLSVCPTATGSQRRRPKSRLHRSTLPHPVYESSCGTSKKGHETSHDRPKRRRECTRANVDEMRCMVPQITLLYGVLFGSDAAIQRPLALCPRITVDARFERGFLYATTRRFDSTPPLYSRSLSLSRSLSRAKYTPVIRKPAGLRRTDGRTSLVVAISYT